MNQDSFKSENEIALLQEKAANYVTDNVLKFIFLDFFLENCHVLLQQVWFKLKTSALSSSRYIKHEFFYHRDIIICQ